MHASPPSSHHAQSPPILSTTLDTRTNPIEVGDDLGVDVHAHEDAIDVEGDWEDQGTNRRALGESRVHLPTLWAKDSFVEETQDPSPWVQVELERLMA